VTQAAFGPVTNALGTAEPAPPPALCPTGTLLAEIGREHPFVCRDADSGVSYYGPLGELLGRLPPAAFASRSAASHPVIAHIDAPAGGVEVIQAIDNLAIANFHSPTMQYLGSLVFAPR
jgi:hypothetical protein